MPPLLKPLDNRLNTLWETKAGEALRRLGLQSVRTTILTLAVLATVIPSLVTGCLSYRQNRRAIEANLAQQLAGSSGQSAREVGLWLKGHLSDLKVFASSYEVTENLERGGATRRLSDYLNSVNDRFPDFHELMVVAPDQHTVAFTGRTPGKLTLPDDWIRRAREGEPVLGDPQRADSTAAATMDVAVPITSPTGRFVGCLVARLDFKAVEVPLRELLAGAGSRILVVRPDGQAIAAVNTRPRKLADENLRKLLQADTAAVEYTATDGVAVIGGQAAVPGTEWLTVAEVPAATAFADIRRLRNTTVLLVLALLGVVGSLAYGLGLLVVLPLERLSKAADRVADGDLQVELPPGTGGGEVSQLTNVFIDMVRRLREGRDELERLSVTDELTGLANRRHLDAELAREAQRHDRHKRAFAVLLLDVDKFKGLNDAHGHPAGDAVLRQLAKVLVENARGGDTVARFGGEEFLLILPETSAEGAVSLAERIRAATEKHKFVIDAAGQVVPVTISIGLSRFPEHGKTPETLIMTADEALYRSKAGGRNRVTTAD